LKYLLFVFLLIPLRLEAEWRTLQPGLEYETRASAHVFRIDLKKFRVGLLMAPDFGIAAMTAQDFRARSGAALVVNGGFFDEAFRGLGLLYRDGKTFQRLRASAWGIFAVSSLKAVILARKDWNPKDVAAALQVGPRLVVDGGLQEFKPAGPSRRSAVGVTEDGRVEIAVSEKPILMEEWAVFMKRDCPNALNLDGGGSTQISSSSASGAGSALNVEGLTAVPNALAVFPRH
jgi:uncharacterized protein YigE (DUF2233 family)